MSSFTRASEIPTYSFPHGTPEKHRSDPFNFQGWPDEPIVSNLMEGIWKIRSPRFQSASASSMTGLTREKAIRFKLLLQMREHQAELERTEGENNPLKKAAVYGIQGGDMVTVQQKEISGIAKLYLAATLTHPGAAMA